MPIKALGFCAEQPNSVRADLTGLTFGPSCEAFMKEGPKLPFTMPGRSTEPWVLERSGRPETTMDGFAQQEHSSVRNAG